MVQNEGMSAGVPSLRMRVWDGVVRLRGGLKGEGAIVAARRGYGCFYS